MDPAKYGEAVARLEEEYLAGGMSADEYTRRRRELEGAEAPDEPGAGTTAWRPMPPIPAQPATHAGGDPVTNALLASWGRRAGGWLVDVLVLAVAYAAVLVLVIVTGDTSGEPNTAVSLLFVVVWFLGPTIYAWLMVGALGQTLGKMAVGVEVVTSRDGSRVTYGRAFGRAASTWLLGLLFLPLLLAYLWPLWDRRNQTLYDKMAGTIVVRVRNAN